MTIEQDHIICGNCNNKFEKRKFKHCSNCFVCTGCEIYYCPYCDERIVVKPVREMDYNKTDQETKP